MRSDLENMETSSTEKSCEEFLQELHEEFEDMLEDIEEQEVVVNLSECAEWDRPWSRRERGTLNGNILF